MADSNINVIKSRGGISFGGPQSKMSPKLLMILTVILAVVSVVTAILLYQRRSEPIAPNAPIPAPAAGEICGGLAGTLCPTGQVCEYTGGVKTAPFPDASGICVEAPAAKAVANIFCEAAFTITASPTPTPTPTPTPSPTPTPTPTPSPTPSGTPNTCNGTCGSNANCGSGLVCDLTSGRCRNASCLTDSDCVCAGLPTPTPTPSPITSVPTPTPTTTLTQAGSVAGTWTISLAGVVLLIAGAALMFAF